MKLFELLLLDWSRRIHEQILTSLGLGERNHVAKAVESGQQHGETVVAVGKAPMGRSAGIEARLMTQILAFTSSPKSKGSVSNDLVAQFVDTWRAHDPSAHVACRDVGLTPPPHLDEATIGAFFTPDDQRGSITDLWQFVSSESMSRYLTHESKKE